MLRIRETLKEMFSEPRIGGVFLIWIIPTIICYLTHLQSPYCEEGTIILSSILFLFCFLCVRFSL